MSNVRGAHDAYGAEGHRISRSCQVTPVSDNVHVLALQVTPDLNTVGPYPAWLYRSIPIKSPLIPVPAVRPCVSSHKRSAWTLLVVGPILAITDVEPKVLEVLMQDGMLG